jgi:hypothetical protein
MTEPDTSDFDQRRQAYPYVVITPGTVNHCMSWEEVSRVVRILAELGTPLRDFEIRGKALPLDVPGHGRIDGSWAAMVR